MLPTDRVLSEMNNLGLPATELGAPGFLPNDANEISEKLGEFEMSLIGGFTPVVVHDKNQNQETLSQVKKVAELFKKTGATHLVSSPVYSWGWDAPKPLSADEYKNMFSMFSQIDKICEDHGLTNVLHPHLQTTVESKDEIERVLDGCDVKWCLDTGHMAIGGVDIVEFAKNAADRVGHVHLKDVDLSKAAPVLARKESIMAGVQKGLFTPLGSGDVPIAQVINVLESAGYQGWYVIEQDCAITGELPAEGAGPALMMNKSMDYLKSLAIG
jgi:inosose dehydratase